MKTKSILLGAVALGLGSAAVNAQTTEITITGATAFRQATMQAIYDAFDSEGDLGIDFNVCHDFTGNNLSQLIASNKAVFSGKFPNITGTTIIRTSFNGSTEGLNAIAGNNNPTFLQTAALGSPGAVIQGGITGPTQTLRPKFSFSDVYQSTSPVDNEVLEPVGSSAVGVVTFAMITNDGAPANFTNTTQQTNAALWKSGVGSVPLSLFTGNASDTIRVFATGRNDGSGTRSAYLTEWQFGVSNLVDQYIQTWNGVSASTPSGVGNGTITRITRVPADGFGSGPATINTSYSSGATSILVDGPVGNLGNNRTISGPGIAPGTLVSSFSGTNPQTLNLNAATTGSGTAGGTVTIAGIGNHATTGASNRSTLWGNTAVGNGGYSSSSALRSLMGYTSGNVTVYNGVSQTPIPGFTNVPILLLTWLSTSDSRDAAAQGAKILSYNGVKVTPLVPADPNNYLGTGFNEEDFNKIRRGIYSAWSYQHLYYHGTLSANEQQWYDDMVAPGGYIEDGLQITANGLRLSDMLVERADDGFPITPL